MLNVISIRADGTGKNWKNKHMLMEMFCHLKCDALYCRVINCWIVSKQHSESCKSALRTDGILMLHNISLGGPKIKEQAWLN